MIARRKKVLGSAYKLFYDEPVHIVRGEGVWLYDSDGRKFLDMYNNVPHVGHCHPHVVEALTRQIRTLNTHTRYLHGGVLEYAEKLTGKFPDELDTVMFSCTGSEANELALRIARACTGGTGLIVTDYAYHGNTKAIFEISTEDIAPEDIPDYVVTVPSPDTYRGIYRDDDAAEKYASHIDSAIETLQSRGIKPAAFVIDTIVSSAGIVTPPAGYLRLAADRIRAAGGLFVADEVQPGFGRMGTHFWGYEADDLIPDIVTMGKPMGNGHPMAATVTRAELVDEFSQRVHYFNTFGGSPVSCAAGMAVLQVLEKEKLQQNALAVGQYLTDGLTELASRHAAIGDVRGSGFFKSVELVKDRESREPATELTARVINGLRERQVLAGSIGKDANILKLRPPMVFTQENADHFLNVLDDVFNES
ncbi:MAG: aspartate aminotransferase family protein [Gammaproteobacteria bacterium]|nr:MAG: aspartate aminotransferase family protein [Gammaproteobacteria bacterium]RLA34114.1 MAG: aspartate aminotransferase family protein [Gammaproteobacteria bacterium]